MINAKEEFLEDTKGKKVICARLETHEYDYELEHRKVIQYKLKEGYNQEALEAFLKSIDFNYDNGYGGQELFGVILCEDGVWFDRGEYDGSEWWQEHKCPTPEQVLRDDEE